MKEAADLTRHGRLAEATEAIQRALRGGSTDAQPASQAPAAPVADADVLRQAVSRKTLVLGLQSFSAADLEAVRAAGETLQVRVLGLAVIAPDVSPALAKATIESLTVLGALHASPAVKAALAGRIR